MEIGTRHPGRTSRQHGELHVDASSTRASPTACTHQYPFYSIGIDGAGNVQAARAEPND